MSEARLLASIWNDRDFIALSMPAQRLYFVLLSHPSRNCVGVVPLTIKRWARLAPDTSEAAIRTGLNELAARQFVVIDWDTEELLIRTFIRNDKVYLQPNVLKAALRMAQEIASPLLRYALHDELLRLPNHSSVDLTRATAYALVETLTEGFPEGIAKASPKGPGERGTYVSEVSDSPSPVPQTPNPSPRPASEASPEASPPQTKPKPRGTRLPEDWKPTNDIIDRMCSELHCTRDALGQEHRRFTDYWLSKSGQTATKVDWGRAWCNWMRTASERGQLNATQNGRPLSTSEQRVMAAQALKHQPTTNQLREITDGPR